MPKNYYSNPDPTLEQAGDAVYSRISGESPEAMAAVRNALKKERTEGKPYLVIAKYASDSTGGTAHYFTFADDEGHAIKIVQAHLNPDRNPGEAINISAPMNPQYSQFTVKRVWECQPLPDARLFTL